jgi:hypothetical protein
VTLHPVDEMPSVRDADLKAHVTGRTATVNIGQGVADTPAGRKLTISDFVFEVPDMAPKPSPARIKFRIEGPVPAAAEMLASDRLSDLSGTLIDPNSSRRSQRICRRQAGDEPEARGQCDENSRQQFGLSGQGRRQDQRATGLAGLSQAG